jgi:hypothetical protein
MRANAGSKKPTALKREILCDLRGGVDRFGHRRAGVRLSFRHPNLLYAHKANLLKTGFSITFSAATD